MNFFKTRLNFFLISYTVLFTNINITAQTEAEPEINRVQQIVIDSQLNQAFNQTWTQFKHNEHFLDQLKTLVTNEKDKFPDQAAILNYLDQTYETVSTIKTAGLIVPDPQKIYTIQKVNIALSQNLVRAISNHNWQAIDLGTIIQRSTKDDLSMEDLSQLIKENQINLKTLEETLETFGLTYSQKIIRKLENGYKNTQFYLEEKKLAPYLKYGAISSLIAVYAIYHSKYLANKINDTWLDHDYFSKLWDNRLTRQLKNLIGSAPSYDLSKLNDKKSHYNYPITNEHQLGALGKLEWSLGKALHTETTPDILIPGTALGWLSYEAIDQSQLGGFSNIIYLSNNPTVRMAALTQTALQVKNSNRYHSFKYYAKRFIAKKYHQLRGKKDLKAEQPTMTFDDVIGMDYAKNEFEAVIDYIVNPDKFERNKLTPAKGYLMIGAPRTGKSYIAKAICGEIRARQKLLGQPSTVNFISLSADELEGQNFDYNMSYINNQAPCVVFIDEIDLLCLNRGDGNKKNKLLSKLLTQMSGMFTDATVRQQDAGNKEVIFIAATNNPQNLDSALLKSGRFSQIIAFEYPQLQERVTFLNQEIKKRAITLDPDFIHKIAEELEGCTFEDLSLVIKNAIQKASSQYTPIGEEHFKYAIEENLKGILPQSQITSPQEINNIASYQAGKALATILLTPDTKISTLTTRPINKKNETRKDCMTTTIPTIEYGGIFTYKNSNLLGLNNEADLNYECQILLAGHIAQELILGSSSYIYRAQDQQAASTIAKQIALKGENYQDLTPDLQQEILRQTYAIKNSCKMKVKELLIQNRAKLAQLTEALATKSHLGSAEIISIIN